MSQHEIEYLERRALEERERAEGANCVASARSHKDMSRAYRASADRLRRADPKP
ncbi:hypothetical protein ACFOMD_01200 [Sphingoaurantiacus capsulatus]|uniref:Uncharacterized protein n=1 Tax=Sphingoaurantiacus capsulatus TaxID=1771310 RepID=A0ABV7X7G9_9SPHN